MTATMHDRGRTRLRRVSLDATTERNANELRGFLVADHPGNRWAEASPSEQALRENIRAGNVRVCEHFVTACRYSGAKAKIIAMILAMSDDDAEAAESDVEVSLAEQCAQCTTDPMQWRWATGQFQSPREYFALGDGLNHEIRNAERLRDRVLMQGAHLIGLGRRA